MKKFNVYLNVHAPISNLAHGSRTRCVVKKNDIFIMLNRQCYAGMMNACQQTFTEYGISIIPGSFNPSAQDAETLPFQAYKIMLEVIRHLEIGELPVKLNLKNRQNEAGKTELFWQGNGTVTLLLSVFAQEELKQILHYAFTGKPSRWIISNIARSCWNGNETGNEALISMFTLLENLLSLMDEEARDEQNRAQKCESKLAKKRGRSDDNSSYFTGDEYDYIPAELPVKASSEERKPSMYKILKPFLRLRRFAQRLRKV